MPESKLTRGGLNTVLAQLYDEIIQLYLADTVPWVIGYSGGKDSTAILQLVWLSLQKLSPEQRVKPVHVISTDTLVENPVVAAWVERSHRVMTKSAEEQKLPIVPHRLTPETNDTFWVNLIGRGYPSPRPKFRWCTERLKINPSNTFITQLIQEHGEAILVLGTRKAESALRARTMSKHESKRVRDRLSPNASLVGCQVYTPIEDWSNDDVWMYLTQQRNPWGWSNHDLMGMYAGATEGGECPLVVDTSTPSCGDSRFGCWVCTLVEKDKSMAAMIQNDAEKEWMLPLLDLRNRLDPRDDDGFRSDTANRDFRRINGNLTLERVPKEAPKTREEQTRAIRAARERHEYFTKIGRIHEYKDNVTSYLVHGPYTQAWREDFLRRVLEAQTWVRQNGPDGVRELTLITIDELEAIRRIWVMEKGEIEDSVPEIYRKAVGEEYPAEALDDQRPFGPDELALLRSACGYDSTKSDQTEDQQAARLRYELLRRLIDVEYGFRSMARRAGLFSEIEGIIDSHAYSGEVEALQVAISKWRSLLASEVAAEKVGEQEHFLQIAEVAIPPEAEVVNAEQNEASGQ